MKKLSKKNAALLLCAMILFVIISLMNWTIWSWVSLGGFALFLLGLYLKERQK